MGRPLSVAARNGAVASTSSSETRLIPSSPIPSLSARIEAESGWKLCIEARYDGHDVVSLSKPFERVEQKLDGSGRVREEQVKVYEVYPSEEPGNTWKRLIEVDGRPISREELDKNDLLRGGVPPQRDLRLDRRPLVVAERAGHVGLDEARRHDVGGDRAAAELAGQ